MSSENKIPQQILVSRSKLGLTQGELAERIGVSKQSVSNWETGSKTPRMGVLQKMADLFNVSVGYLTDGQPDEADSEILPIYRKLTTTRQHKVYDFANNQLIEQKKLEALTQPRHAVRPAKDTADQTDADNPDALKEIDWYGYVSAGTGEFMIDFGKKDQELPASQIPREADFCLTVNGNSMEPVFKDGSLVFVKRQEELSNGAIGVVIVDNDAFLKRIWFETDHARLESFNPKYPDRIISDFQDFRIVGKVVL
ncbi:MAG: XRE family transcriptional regulator [Lactobacillus sp.]|nr:XRE family transcriptional regulator [Lactobacillus sp.]